MSYLEGSVESHHMAPDSLPNSMHPLGEFISKNGEDIKGDHMFQTKYCIEILTHGLDYYKGEKAWRKELKNEINDVLKRPLSIHIYKQHVELDKTLKYGFSPKHHITNIIDLLEENKVPDFNPSCNECSFVIKQNSLGNTEFENSNELYTDVLFETAKVKAFRKKNGGGKKKEEKNKIEELNKDK